MDLIESIVLAVVQGATEFIPVSSSGHLVLVREFLGWSDEHGVFVDVALHAASLLAIFIYFFKDWLEMLLGLFQWKNPGYAESRRVLLLLLLATVPVVLLGPWLEKGMGVLRNGSLIGGVMIATAGWFFLCEWLHRSWKERLGSGTALLMGIAQVVAILPGASRSGLTISTGLLCGQRRERAARFSFFMVAPTIIGATILEFSHISVENMQALAFPVAVGFVVCFAVSIACIHFCLKLFRRVTLKGFGVYLLGLGVTVLLIHFIR